MTIGRPAEEAVSLLLGRRLDAVEARSLARRKRAHYTRLAERGMLPIRGVCAFVDHSCTPACRARWPPRPRVGTSTRS